MELFAQIPGAEQAIRSAEASGWTAVLVCVTFLFTLGVLTWLIKKMFTEKDELASRLTSVEEFQRSELTDLHVRTERACNRASEACEGNKKAIEHLTQCLTARPCLLPESHTHGT